jgi:hypothetical protein
MGGARETIAEAQKTGKSEGSVIEMANGLDIRYHESDGEVHFHDDKTPIKCAVPVAEFWDAWQKFKTKVNSFIYFVDDTNNTSVTISWFPDNAIDDNVDITIRLRSVNIKKTFSDMDAFMEGK